MRPSRYWRVPRNTQPGTGRAIAPFCIMELARLNRQDAELNAHALRAIRAVKQAKHDARTTRALIQEALTARDNARGDMLRAFLRNA